MNPIIAEAKKDQKLIEEHYDEQYKEIKRLLVLRKKLFKKRRSIRPVEQPVVLLLRQNREIEIYEGVKSNTFVVPKNDDTGRMGFGDPKNTERGKRVVHMTNKDLWTMKYGSDELRCYILHEDDAAPIKTDPQVWSELMEFDIQALLANALAYKTKEDSTMSWLFKILIWGGVVAGGFYLLKMMLTNPEQAPQVIVNTADLVRNATVNTSASNVITIG